jgi:hypothetical protein
MTTQHPPIRIENLEERLHALPPLARYRLRRTLRRLPAAVVVRSEPWAA